VVEASATTDAGLKGVRVSTYRRSRAPARSGVEQRARTAGRARPRPDGTDGDEPLCSRSAPRLRRSRPPRAVDSARPCSSLSWSATPSDLGRARRSLTPSMRPTFSVRSPSVQSSMCLTPRRRARLRNRPGARGRISRPRGRERARALPRLRQPRQGAALNAIPIAELVLQQNAVSLRRLSASLVERPVWNGSPFLSLASRGPLARRTPMHPADLAYCGGSSRFERFGRRERLASRRFAEAMSTFQSSVVLEEISRCARCHEGSRARSPRVGIHRRTTLPAAIRAAFSACLVSGRGALALFAARALSAREAGPRPRLMGLGNSEIVSTLHKSRDAREDAPWPRSSKAGVRSSTSRSSSLLRPGSGPRPRRCSRSRVHDLWLSST